jgi:hypothetical protein
VGKKYISKHKLKDRQWMNYCWSCPYLHINKSGDTGYCSHPYVDNKKPFPYTYDKCPYIF